VEVGKRQEGPGWSTAADWGEKCVGFPPSQEETGMEARGRPGSGVVQEAGRRTGCSKDERFWEGKEKMT
jgi:hypothetical protein